MPTVGPLITQLVDLKTDANSFSRDKKHCHEMRDLDPNNNPFGI